jgi:hypothetical protein
MLIDARLDNEKREVYETLTGGEKWILVQNPPESIGTRKAGSGWRVRTDAATHSYVIEKSENNRWQKIASFLVNIATCKE